MSPITLHPSIRRFFQPLFSVSDKMLTLSQENILYRLAFGAFGSLVIIYALFQKKFLPKPIARIAARIFFFPTLPLTAFSRWGNYWTHIDNTIILGAAPLGGIFQHPKMLLNLGVKGVINLCDEYSGPKSDYLDLGIKQLRLPVVDHFEPNCEQIEEAIKFIKVFKDKGEKVYIHCKAGHGRSAAIAFCWLWNKNPSTNLIELNSYLTSKRHVRKTLYKQKNVQAFIKNFNRDSR